MRAYRQNIHLVFFFVLWGCDKPNHPISGKEQGEAPLSQKPLAEPASSETVPAAAGNATDQQHPQGEASEASPAQRPWECPAGSIAIKGGSFLVGNQKRTYEEEENPRFKTRLPDFCADKTEVTTELYEACVAEGACSPSRGTNLTCNTVAKGRGQHPINCIDWEQASSVCQWRDMRLPTEVEWEYLARGGSQMLKYPWG
ncbi:MAG: formylglycine-generating enzyme family protein, partial [Polyangiaceae bacterium]|nr:formylglycine-generating enzyme family protein [Polyangiaceae bacterium]